MSQWIAFPYDADEYTQARSTTDTLFLHDFPDGWRVTGAGCHPRNDQVYDCTVGGR